MDTNREQCESMLAAWDRGESVWSIEMGGLGPGYEQAIQVLAIEILRDNIDNIPNDSTWRNWGDETANRLDKRGDDGKYAMGGFSGAQVEAAKNLAYKWLTVGPEALNTLASVKDRRIQISNFWPGVRS